MVTKYDFYSASAAASPMQTLSQLGNPNREQCIGEVPPPGIQPLLCLHGLPILISSHIVGSLKLESAMEASVLSSHKFKTPLNSLNSIRNRLKICAAGAWTRTSAQTLITKWPGFEKDMEKGERRINYRWLNLRQISLGAGVYEVTVGAFWGACQWKLLLCVPQPGPVTK